MVYYVAFMYVDHVVSFCATNVPLHPRRWTNSTTWWPTWQKDVWDFCKSWPLIETSWFFHVPGVWPNWCKRMPVIWNNIWWSTRLRHWKRFLAKQQWEWSDGVSAKKPVINDYTRDSQVYFSKIRFIVCFGNQWGLPPPTNKARNTDQLKSIRVEDCSASRIEDKQAILAKIGAQDGISDWNLDMVWNGMMFVFRCIQGKMTSRSFVSVQKEWFGWCLRSLKDDLRSCILGRKCWQTQERTSHIQILSMTLICVSHCKEEVEQFNHRCLVYWKYQFSSLHVYIIFLIICMLTSNRS